MNASAPKRFVQPPPNASIQPRGGGPLAELERAWDARAGDGRSGFLLLDRNDDALNWRLALIDSAERSLDLQYYLWHADLSGRLLIERVLCAADRGVRVRILMDDILFFGRNRSVATMDAHPNVDVRIFNPWQDREGGALGRAIEFLARTKKLNSRMHNKLLVADDRAAICGGRNVGDHYFGWAEDFNFHDLDVLAVGRTSRQLSDVFELYWKADTVSAAHAPGWKADRRLAASRWRIRRGLSKAAARPPIGIESRQWCEELAGLPGRMQEGSSVAIYDLPGGEQVTDDSSREALERVLAGAEREVWIENAYWVPRARSLQFFAGFLARGGRVVFVTNSLASQDVAAVNSAFKKWRKRVVEMGIELHELRHDAQLRAFQDTPPVKSEFLGLHTKAFVVDGALAYVGSHNFDPRSHEINSELGLLIQSEGLALDIQQIIERDRSPENAWRVHLENGKVRWTDSDRTLKRQPARNIRQRIADFILGLLPIADQL